MDEQMEEEPPMEEPEGEADRYGMMEKNEISEELAAAIKASRTDGDAGVAGRRKSQGDIRRGPSRDSGCVIL